MAISTTMTQAFKVDLLDGSFSGFTAESPNDTFKLALYTSSATLDATTTVYSGTNEAAGTGSPEVYVAGGQFVVRASAPTWTTDAAWVDFEDVVWSTITITANGALFYDTVNSNAAISTHAFGSDKSASGGDFTVQMPTGDNNTALIRIA